MRTASQQLAALAVERPDAVAVALPGSPAGNVSYGELAASSHRLAHALVAAGTGPGDTVGLLLPRGPDFVTGVFGVLAAGAACLPLDPLDPPARAGAALALCGVRLLVSASGVDSSWVSGDLTVLDVATAGRGRPETPPAPAAGPDDPAFVFSTSGSTGTPKGVVLPHRAYAEHLDWVAATFDLGAADRHLFKTTVSFVSILRHLMWPLLTGGRTVVVPPGREKDVRYLARVIAEEQITITTAMPSVLRLLMELPEPLDSLRHLACGGEPLLAPLRERVFARLPGVGLHNIYAMTEAPLVTHHRCVPGEPGPAPIGVPVPGMTVRIVPADGTSAAPGELAADGAPGELYVGGPIAHGYLGQADQHRFRGPFAPGDPPVLYRTGDAVRRRPDGLLEYRGRTDDMVKVRGYRVELRDVEAALAGHPGVAQAAVVVRGDQLVGYLVGHAGSADPDPARVRAFLAERVPAYLVPALLVVLDALPLLPTGKVDRAALPDPAIPAGRGGAAPEDPLEKGILDIWGEVLGVPGIGRHDRFADLGGDSLRAVEIALRLEELVGRELPFEVFRGAGTVAELAASVRRVTDPS